LYWELAEKSHYGRITIGTYNCGLHAA
jgi:hypothetical protein